MGEVVVTAKKIKNRKKRIKRTKIVIFIVLIFLIISFIILSIIYNGGKFTVTLDNNFALKSGIILYEDEEFKNDKTRKLYAKNIDFLDNISIDWIPVDIDNEATGSHNGENYIAYTFYLENKGERTINYWYSLYIDDVIKNVDEAVRVMIFLNGEKQVYAKINSATKSAEKDTKVFLENEEKEIILEERKDFKVDDKDKFTVVIWLEGDDPDCVDAIIGGEIKMHMEIREEHIEQESEKSDEKK